MLYIGIDTGLHTGFAVWDTTTGKFTEVRTLKIHQAMERIYELNARNYLTVYFEDARQRKWIPNSHDLRTEMGRRQGAGSVKRDAAIWEDFLKDKGIPYRAVAPAKGRTKMSPDYFASVTGWAGRTSEHSRDAAMLVFASMDNKPNKR